MTPRTAIGAFASAFGVVVGVVGFAAVAAAVLVALGLPAQGRADDGLPPSSSPEPRPSTLVVALDLRDPVRQAGVVKGGDVILARGLEIDIAREIARRVGIPRVRFVYVRSATRLLAATAPPWHFGIASIRATRGSAVAAELSDPYLDTDQAVVLRRGLPRLTTLGQLRVLRSCALRGSDGARALADVVVPALSPALPSRPDRLFQLVQTGACDAALVDADDVGRFVAGRGALLGPVAARVAYGSGFSVAITRGGPIGAAEVGRALSRMRADGTMHRLARTWLQIDPARLRVLR
ncbi:substrate-binding periplasmic protein [Gaiella sp.]|uniref:substrate-binding periplasmic protein n=1 Tax=Gaiella sp. TaxID=2663207 RepID=UPI003983BB59